MSKGITMHIGFDNRYEQKGQRHMNQQFQQQITIITAQDYGIPSYLKGYYYLKEAVALVLQTPTISAMQIYQTIAKYHNIKPASIERPIRYAIEVAYDRNKLNHKFPNCFGQPSNSEVIWTIAESVTLSDFSYSAHDIS